MSAELVSMHREISLQVLKSLDNTSYAVRTPRGQKDPGHYGWDPKTNSPEKSRENIYRLEQGDDNLGIHLFGRVVDVDIDTDNPFLMDALDYFMPPTPHTWGRGDRKRTHRLYEIAQSMEGDFDPSLFPFLRTIQKHDEIKVEIRGGNQKAGEYSLMPGSLHPSGEEYEWDNPKSARSTPVAVDMYRVVNGVRFACVAAMIAPYWTEGSRNDLCMAFSGFLHRAATHVDDMGSNSKLFFERKDALELLKCVMEIAGDDESDQQMRIKTFEKTWDKADEGHPVSGATTLVKLTGNENIIPVYYALLADSEDLIKFDDFLDRYAIRNNTSNVVDLDKAGSKAANFIMTVNDFRNSNMHMTIATSSGERRQMVNILLSSTRAIRVDGMAFVPEEERIIERYGEKFINQWRGYAIEPWQGDFDPSEVQIFTDYVHTIVANGDAAAAHWVLAWLADMFQFPSEKSGTALALVGKPGAGKSILGGAVIRKIIGFNHSMQTNTIESLTGNFNVDSANMLFVQGDEVSNTRRKSDALKLKSMITDPTRRVEPKNVNAYQQEDCARYFFTSNETNDAVAILDGNDDRRYTVLEVNNDYATSSEAKTEEEKQEFWNGLYEWLKDESNLAKLHRYFREYQYDRNVIRKPYGTEAKKRIQQHSQRGFDDWLMTIVSLEHPLENLHDREQRLEESYKHEKGKYVPCFDDWPDYLSYKRLEDGYEAYRKRRGMAATTPSYNAQQLKQEFVTRGLLPEKPKSTRIDHTYEVWKDGEPVPFKKRIRITEFPERGKIEEFLEKRLGFVVEHNEVEAEVESVTSGAPEF